MSDAARLASKGGRSRFMCSVRLIRIVAYDEERIDAALPENQSWRILCQMPSPAAIPGPQHEAVSSRSAVGKVLCVLDYLSSLRRGASVAEIATALGLSRSQAHRIVAGLTAEGVLRRHPASGQVIFGPRLAQVALRLLGGSSIRPLWHVVLRQLVDDIGETCNLVVYDQCFGTYFDRIEVNWPLSAQFHVGSRIPLHCTVGGKLYLALLPKNERQAVLDCLMLKPFTHRTFTDRPLLERHLSAITECDYSTNEGEFFPDLIAVGVPVRDAESRLLATLGMPAPRSRLSLTEAEAYVPRLRLAAAQLVAVFKAQTLSV